MKLPVPTKEKQKNRWQRPLWVLAFIMGVITLASAQRWEIAYGTNGNDEGYAIVEETNGDFVLGGYGKVDLAGDGIYITRVDRDGDPVWSRTYGMSNFNDRGFDLISTSEGFIAVGRTEVTLGDDFDGVLLSVDKNGMQLWIKRYGGTGREKLNSVIETTDGQFLAGGKSDSYTGSEDFYFIKFDSNGDTTWTKHYDNLGNDDEIKDILETNDAYLAIGRSQDGSMGTGIFIIEIDKTSGDEIRRSIIEKPGFLEPNAITAKNDGFLIAGAYSSTGIRAYILEIDNNLQEVGGSIKFFGNWLEQGFNTIIPTTDGNYAAAGFYIETGVSPPEAYIVKIDPNGTELKSQITGKVVGRQIFGVTETMDKDLAFVGTLGDFQFVTDVLFLRTDSNLYLPKKFIEGHVFVDMGGNCVRDDSWGERLMNNWIVSVGNGQTTQYVTTDENGKYLLRVDSGAYEVGVLLENNYWTHCTGDNFSIDFNIPSDTNHLDLPIKIGHDCVYFEVDISAPAVKICEDVTYHVNYCNYGAADANDARIEVLMDAFMTVNTSSVPIASQDGRLYTFNIGDVASGDCGTFTIQASVDCDEPIQGQAHCVTAHIYPDSICTAPGSQWNGASIQVDGICENDTIRFKVTNKGSGDMIGARKALIVEDMILGREVTVDLGGGESVDIPGIEGNGKTFRLIMEQEDGHPGRSYPTIAVEGCAAPGSSFSTGFVNQFEEDDRNAFASVECIENTVTTDNIELRGYPKGIYDSLITSKTDLEYHIRFRNAGTDTAGRVVIRDTLSEFLDLSTISPGASSHPYSFRVFGNRVVKFIFDDIQLVGSDINEAASTGFVKFKISQIPGNPEGTVIENKVGVNMGNELLENSNVTRHVIKGERITDFIEVATSTDEVFFPGVEIKVYPNPFLDQATVEIAGKQFRQYIFEIYSMTGQPVRKGTFTENRFNINRENLSSGVYFYRITADGYLLNTGKILVGQSGRN